jgi:hypothetical protein
MLSTFKCIYHNGTKKQELKRTHARKRYHQATFSEKLAIGNDLTTANCLPAESHAGEETRRYRVSGSAAFISKC